MALNTVEEILDDIRQGKMVILMDDEDRENEGDLLVPAETVTPEDINESYPIRRFVETCEQQTGK